MHYRSDFAFALRSLRRRPGFTTVAVSTIALAIAANTSIFSVVYGVLLRPLPYPDAGALVVLNARAQTGHSKSVSIPNYRDWRDQSHVFSAFAGSAPWHFTLRGYGDAQVITGRLVVDDFFATLGMPAARGRAIAAIEAPDRQGGTQVAVISNRFWTSELAGRTSVLGTALSLDDRSYTIVGVLPPHMGFPGPDVDVYVPMATIPGLPWTARASGFGTEAIARLEPGTTMDMGARDIVRLGSNLRASYGAAVDVPEIRALSDDILGDLRERLWLLMAAVTLVLLIAVANVGNLMLAASERRHRELAVRAALGAQHHELIGLLLTEALVIGVVGGALGVMLAYLGVTAAVPMLAADIPSAVLSRIVVNGTVAAWGVLLSIATTVLFGLAPLSRTVRQTMAATLKSGTRTVGTDSRRLREALVVGEVALAVMLVVGSGLLIRSLQRLLTVDKGFTASGVLTASVTPPAARMATRDQWVGFNDALVERVRSIPGVTSAAMTLLLPLSNSSWELLVYPEGAPVRDSTGTSVLYNIVSPDYFRTLRVPLVRGRSFGPSDRDGSNPVAIIDETMATQFWAGVDPIGKRITFEQDSAGSQVYRTVVGVARNVRHYALTEPSRVQVYIPMHQALMRWGARLRVAAQTSGPPALLATALRRAILEVEPQAVVSLRPLQDNVDAATSTSVAMARALGVFAIAAIVLSALGIFGVVSYTVTQRTREIGVRMALGAAPADVMRWVVARASRLTGLGLVTGVGGALVVSRMLRHLVFDVSVLDPQTFVVAIALLGLVGIAAAVIPGVRAARVDPLRALAQEE